MLMSSEKNIIAPNIHYNKANPDIPALLDGSIIVVDEATPWQGGRVGINSYGFGGANVHALFETNMQEKDDKTYAPTQMLVCSGRTIEWVEEMLNLVQAHPLDVGLHALLDVQVNVSVKSHPARGYTLLSGRQTRQIQVMGNS